MLTARRTYEILENQSLWAVATHVHDLLAAEGIPHAIVGGVAVCLHGYRRNTVDLDLLVNREDAVRVSDIARDRAVRVKLVLAGDREGPGQPTVFPDPANAVTMIEDLPVLTLAHLIQAKLACGLGNLRRTHKHFADVVELIAMHDLGKAFATRLHKSVRAEFKALVQNAQG